MCKVKLHNTACRLLTSDVSSGGGGQTSAENQEAFMSIYNTVEKRETKLNDVCCTPERDGRIEEGRSNRIQRCKERVKIIIFIFFRKRTDLNAC